MKTLERRLPAVAAVAAAALYLSLPSARYNFDGVACAIAVELGEWRYLVHGNHVAYGLLGWLWFSLWKAAGYAGPALASLQALSSLLSAAAVGVYARLLLRCGLSVSLALAASAGLAVSDLYWSWALEAQVYPLGVLFLFLAASQAIKDEPDPVKLGLYHAGAILGHVGHAMFIPASLWLLYSAPAGSGTFPEHQRSRRLWIYAAVLCSCVLVAYAAAVLACVKPKSFQELFVWFLGSAALGVERKFQWVGGHSPEHLLIWMKTTLLIVGGNVWVGLLSVALAALGAFFSWGTRPRLVKACLLWLAGYALLFSSWHPSQPVYRITDLAALWILMALAVERARALCPQSGFLPTLGLAALAVFLGGSHLVTTALPDSDPSRNADLQRSLWIARETPQGAWIVVDGVDQVYIPYFAHRHPLNLRYWWGRHTALRDLLDSMVETGTPVFLVPQAMTPAWKQWALQQKLREIRHRDDEVLCQLMPSQSRVRGR